MVSLRLITVRNTAVLLVPDFRIHFPGPWRLALVLS
jgi:hypothetical protein